MRYLTLSIKEGDDHIAKTICVPDDVNNWAILEAAMFHIMELWPENRSTEIIEKFISKELTP